MALKSQGIYLRWRDVVFQNFGWQGASYLNFRRPEIHGIVNGGHTSAAIREAITGDQTTESELELIDKAYVRIHLMQGLPQDKVSDIAEGLNKSKPVDNPSLLKSSRFL
jgi:hypothetical protein